MSKLIGLTLNNKLGILQAQSCEFSTSPDKLITIKGGVGTGKTTLNKASQIALGAGSERETPVDMKAYDGADVEIQITYGEIPVFMRTVYKDNNMTSTLYIKDVDGKKVTNPVINGKKITAAGMRDILKTQLTFGISEFISEDPRVQMAWMMEVYKDKLKEKGVVFDKKSPNYQGSLLYQLEQAKIKRSQLYERMRGLNGFRAALESEGLRETSIPDYIDIAVIEKEKALSTKKYYETLQELERKLSDIKVKSQGSTSFMDSYNSSLEEKKKIVDDRNRLNVDAFNKDIDSQIEKRNEIHKHIQFLSEAGAPIKELNDWFEKLPAVPKKKEFEESEVLAISKNEKGNYIHDKQYPDEVEKVFNDLESYRKEYLAIEKEKSEVKEPEDVFTSQIDEAKASNRIAERWASFFDHQKADEEVKKIFSEYRKIFTSIDLGVEGLRIDIVGNEDDMNLRTVYNGSHNPKLFGNLKAEYRPISSYSETQKNILAILMQIHLLDEKKKSGDDALRYMFIESPMDTKTKDMLLDYQKKYDLQLLCTVTCDVDVQDIKDGEIVLENGYLLTNKK
jgi:hypothetical protein